MLWRGGAAPAGSDTACVPSPTLLALFKGRFLLRTQLAVAREALGNFVSPQERHEQRKDTWLYLRRPTGERLGKS